MPRKTVFLDRDGVINSSPDGRYVTSWKEFRFLPGSLAALRALHRSGFRLIVVSNQAGVARGLLTRVALQNITRRMLEAVRRAGGKLDAVYCCPHLPSARCGCRKPKLGLIRRATRRFAIDLKHSYLVGDNRKDILLGRRAGCMTVLVRSGRESRRALHNGRLHPDHIAQNLEEAARWIKRQNHRC